MITHGLEKRISLIVTTTKAEEERTEHSKRDHRGDDVGNISCTQVSVINSRQSNRFFYAHRVDLTDLDAVVFPRKLGISGGTFSRTSGGGVTGRCTKCVVARSRICFWS
jgi:hypothetical protein